jgi:hypothetical protein
MLMTLMARERDEDTVARPNLLIRTGPHCTTTCDRDCEEHSGMLLPILMFKA